MNVKLVAQGNLYRNQFPADFHANAYNPRIVEIAEDELICVYRRSTAMYAEDGKPWVLSSKDNGETWVEAGCALNSSTINDGYSYSASNLTRLSAGELVISGFRFRRSDPSMTFVNGKTNGMLQTETVLIWSHDGGKSWESPQILPPLTINRNRKTPLQLICYESVVELQNGDLALMHDPFNTYDDPEKFSPVPLVLISKDKGQTWIEKSVIAQDPEGEKTFWHARLAVLPNGNIVGFPWTGNQDVTKMLDLHRVESSDHGRTWSTPKPTGIQGQTNRPVVLNETGGLALIVTIRECEKPGIYCITSSDYGKSWDHEKMLQVWDAYGKDSLGVPRTENYPASHDSIAFGAPDLCKLSNGQLMASFWCSQQNQIVCRWCKLQLIDYLTESK